MTANEKRLQIEGEPHPETGTLEEWVAHRRRLNALPRGDQAVKLAIVIADTQICRLAELQETHGTVDDEKKSA